MVINNIGLKIALIVFIIFIINGLIEGKKNIDKCESCDKLVKNFIQASFSFENSNLKIIFFSLKFLRI
jgi:hypothetical protein